MLLAWTGATGAADETRPPNVVFFFADDLGYGELGCYGQKIIRTPNLDQLAADGIRFTQNYTGNTVCAPSRCCLLTGKHPGHAFIRNNGNPDYLEDLKKKYDWVFPGQHPIPDSEITTAEVLKQKGYATAAIGKWGLGNVGTTGDPNKQGFDLFYGFNCQGHAHNHYPKFLWRNDQKEILPGNDATLYGQTYSQDKFIENAAAFIKANRDKPFFLYLPFTIPHLSIQVPEESLVEYRGTIAEEDYKHTAYLKHPTPRAAYAAMITHLDRGIGQVLALLDELTLADNTLVMFSSDNGPINGRYGGTDMDFFNGTGPLRGFKGSLYEGGIRVPLIARWPGKIAPGGVSELPVAFWDVLPTIAEATGCQPPEGIDGISYLPTLLGKPEQQKKHEFFYWEFPSYGGQQAVRMGPWKGIRQKMLGKQPQLDIELYNLDADIAEKHNVAAEHPDIVAQIAKIMKEQHTPSKLFPFPALDVK